MPAAKEKTSSVAPGEEGAVERQFNKKIARARKTQAVNAQITKNILEKGVRDREATAKISVKWRDPGISKGAGGDMPEVGQRPAKDQTGRGAYQPGDLGSLGAGYESAAGGGSESGPTQANSGNGGGIGDGAEEEDSDSIGLKSKKSWDGQDKVGYEGNDQLAYARAQQELMQQRHDEAKKKHQADLDRMQENGDGETDAKNKLADARLWQGQQDSEQEQDQQVQEKEKQKQQQDFNETELEQEEEDQRKESFDRARRSAVAKESGVAGKTGVAGTADAGQAAGALIRSPKFWAGIANALFWPGLIALACAVLLIGFCDTFAGKVLTFFGKDPFGVCTMLGFSEPDVDEKASETAVSGTGLVYIVNPDQANDQTAALTTLLTAASANMKIWVSSVSDDRLFSGECRPWDAANPGTCAHTLSPVISAHYGGPDNTVQPTADARRHTMGFSCAADIWSNNIPALAQLLTQWKDSGLFSIVNVRCEISGGSTLVGCNSGNVGHIHISVSGCGAI